jgi:hypothetical protein
MVLQETVKQSSVVPYVSAGQVEAISDLVEYRKIIAIEYFTEIPT